MHCIVLKEPECSSQLVLVVQDDADARKKQVSSEYQFIRDLIDMDERNALKSVDKDLESGQTKLQSLTKKFGQNVEKMNKTKAEINSLLTKADSLAFLQVLYMWSQRNMRDKQLDVY